MPAKRPIEERFVEKVDKDSSKSTWGGTKCHEWTGHIMPNGYGQIRHNGKAAYAHRVSWELARGPINGLYVLHRCDNRRCVNPDHLFLGTFADNMADMVSKGRQAAGSRNSHAKITEADALAIRRSSELQSVLASRYGISQAIVSEIQNGHIWRHIEKI